MKTIAKLMALCMLLGTLALAQDKPADNKAPAAASDKDKGKKGKKEKKSKKDKDKDKDKDKGGDKK